MKKKTIKDLKGIERERAKEQGFYDGRFKPKVVPDKKKEAEKKLSRSKKIKKTDTDDTK